VKRIRKGIATGEEKSQREVLLGSTEGRGHGSETFQGRRAVGVGVFGIAIIALNDQETESIASSRSEWRYTLVCRMGAFSQS